MFSQRGVLNLAHTVGDLQEMGRRGTAINLNGIDTVFMTPEEIKKKVPLINLEGRYPIMGGLFQPRAGNARHDAVAWGYARGASALGVDIISAQVSFSYTDPPYPSVIIVSPLVRTDNLKIPLTVILTPLGFLYTVPIG